MVRVAYWDTEADRGNPPPLLGAIQGTPTIKAFAPKRASASNRKVVSEYSGAREVEDLRRFAVDLMPNFVESVEGDEALHALFDRGKKWHIPVVLLFSDTTNTPMIVKALSTQYRRRVIIGELKSWKSRDIAELYRVTTYPTLIGFYVEHVRGDKFEGHHGEKTPLRFEKKRPSHLSLDLYLSKLALPKPVTSRPVDAKDEL